MDKHIRSAYLSEDAALAAFLRALFTDTYGAVLPAATLAKYLDQCMTPAVVARDIGHASRRMLVAVNARGIIASARLSRAAPPPCVTDASAIGLDRFYLAHAQRGTGLAQQLLEACEAHARAMQACVLWLCVWQHNPRAHRFYARAGYSVIGASDVPVGDVIFRDHVMVKAL
jgi:GNAT superfamily N-acetyltransferase